MTMEKVRVRDIIIGGDTEPLVIIAGPCVIETRDHALRHAEMLRAICSRLGLPAVFKASYDKANRTSIDGYRGPGLEEGLRILQQVRSDCGLPVLTDVHETAEVGAAAEVVDLLQIPAFLCRQTSLVQAAARTGRPVNVKKGQFLAPWDAASIVEKIRACAGPGHCLLTERGTSFGYNNLVVDFRSLPIMRGHGVPVVFDGSHSVQLPGAGPDGRSSAGRRELIPVLTSAAVAAGVDAVFLEVHEDPDHAPCDGRNMLPIAELEPLLSRLCRLKDAVR